MNRLMKEIKHFFNEFEKDYAISLDFLSLVKYYNFWYTGKIANIVLFLFLKFYNVIYRENINAWITPENAYNFCNNIIKSRSEEMEKIILRSTYFSYLYARDILRGRWPEAEPEILKDFITANIYAEEVIKGRWIDLEKEYSGFSSNKPHYEILDYMIRMESIGIKF